MSRCSREEVERLRSGMLDAVVNADSLTDIVRLSLRRDILTLALEPGARLTLRALKSRYGVGATPLREALWSLAGEGLISNEPQVGFRVAEASRERLVGLSALRQHMEPWALRRAMQSDDRSWIERVDVSYARLTPIDALVGDLRAIDPEWEKAHRNFHLSVLAGCKVPALLREISRWYEETDRYRRLISPTLGFTVGNKPDHDLLYEAVRNGDVELATATLEAHIAGTTARHLSYFDRARPADDCPLRPARARA